MSVLVPWADDDIVETCGWCGHEHPRGHDCGCVPCPSCDDYHGGQDCP